MAVIVGTLDVILGLHLMHPNQVNNILPMRFNALYLILTIGLLTPLCSTGQSIVLPDIGDPSQRYLSAEKERRLGLVTLKQIRDRGLILQDVQLTEYLSSIGQSLAVFGRNDGNAFTFFLVNDPGINAFAAPGGFIGVQSGLILATQSEDELAGVLAHEIAHITQGHIARAFAEAQSMSIPMAAALVASALVAAASPQAGSAIMAGTMAAQAQHSINFTRANEQEADRIGTQILTQAGFDPNGMADFFKRLERLAAGAAAQIPEFLRDHPRPSSRIADTQDRLGKQTRRKNRDTEPYQLAKVRLYVLTNHDDGDLIREFETNLAKGNYENANAERYGYALALKRAGRYDEALRQIARLRTVRPDDLAFRLEEAEINLAKGDKVSAWHLFENAEQLYGDDFTLAMHYGQALTSQGDPRKAMQILEPQLSRRPNDAPLYALYAQAAQRAGDITAVRTTLAEYYYMNGDLMRAVEQLELGLKSPETTPYQEARLRARLRQLKELKEEAKAQ